MKFLLELLSFVLIFCECNLQNFNEETDDDNLTTIQIIEKYGYTAEKHTVETEDGYLLEMHRIPNTVADYTDSDDVDRREFPVLIQHGLFGTSADFVLLGPKNSLAFLLSNLGFDVWLGNVRGNTYSRAHTYLSPDEQEFWNFSWHESGLYDIPAQINHILNETKTEKVIYIGHSMGTTTFFVMTSTLPKYNDKIELSLLMAPIAYVKNVKSPLVRALLPFSKTITIADEFFARGEFLPHSKLFQIFTDLFCLPNRIQLKLCESIIFLISGADPKEFDQHLLKSFLGHYPSGYSVKGVDHYAQLAKSGAFREFDYGRKGNMETYNQLTPPDYNVSSVTAEINFYIGLNDFLSTPTDVKRLAKKLPTLEKLQPVNFTKFSHIDFLIAKDAKKLLYDTVIKDILSHLNK